MEKAITEMVHGQQVFGILKKKYYVTFASLSTGKTYIYSTADIENGPWHKSEFKGYLHDISLLTTKDKMYVVYGSGTALCRELSEDENGDISFGEESTLIKHTALDKDGNPVNGAVNYVSEGIHAYQIGEYYYLFMIQWPSGGRARRSAGDRKRLIQKAGRAERSLIQAWSSMARWMKPELPGGV